jgi:Predicted transcriptional regulator containing the HTH domain
MDAPLRLISTNPLDQLAKTLEALLVVASAPLSVQELADAAADDVERVEAALGLVGERYREGRSGVVWRRWPAAGPSARRVTRRRRALACSSGPRSGTSRRRRLETLAIVAYLGPCTRPDIARIRGVARIRRLRTWWSGG